VYYVRLPFGKGACETPRESATRERPGRQSKWAQMANVITCLDDCGHFMTSSSQFLNILVYRNILAGDSSTSIAIMYHGDT
jgi:hypothetical protein